MFHIAVVESIHSKAIELIKNNKHFSFELIENIQEDNLINKLKKCDAIALRTAKLTGKIIDSCEKLKIVSRHGVGRHADVVAGLVVAASGAAVLWLGV